MIGFTRLALALIVCAHHLTWEWMRIAQLAVLVFYALSGYLITAMLQGPYRGRLGAFWLNRLLRICPAYWAVFLLSLAAFQVLPPLEGLGIGTPGLSSVMKQVFLVIDAEKIRVIPPAWTLSVELFWWAAMSLGIGSSPFRAKLWLLASVGMLIFSGYDYSSIAGGAIPFALGACIYWAGIELPRDSTNLTRLAAALSYLIYLVHRGVGESLAIILGIDPGMPLFLISLPIILCLSWLLHVYVEKPIELIRCQVRKF